MQANVQRGLNAMSRIRGKGPTIAFVARTATEVGEEQFPSLEPIIPWITEIQGMGKQGAWELLMKLGLLLSENPTCSDYLEREQPIAKLFGQPITAICWNKGA